MISILHVNRKELISILRKMKDALKIPGYIFTSFQDGDEEEYMEDGRYYNALTFDMFSDFASRSNLEIIDYGRNPVIMTSRTGEKYWNSFILRKK